MEDHTRSLLKAMGVGLSIVVAIGVGGTVLVARSCSNMEFHFGPRTAAEWCRRERHERPLTRLVDGAAIGGAQFPHPGAGGMTDVEVSFILHAPQPITGWADMVGRALNEARRRPGPSRLLPGDVPAVRQAADLLDRYCSDVDPTGPPPQSVPSNATVVTPPFSRPPG